MTGLYWMRFCIPDYLADTTHLTTIQHGIYDLLIFTCFNRRGSLPDDDRQLATITKMTCKRWLAHRATMAAFFIVADGVWRHKRVDIELLNGTRFLGRQSTAGKASARSKALKKLETGSTTVQPRLPKKFNHGSTNQQSEVSSKQSQTQTHGSRNGSRNPNHRLIDRTGRHARDPKTEDSKSDSRDPVDATRPTAEVIEHQGAWFNAAGAELRRRLPADIAEPIIAAALKGRADAKATLEKYWRSRSRRGRV